MSKYQHGVYVSEKVADAPVSATSLLGLQVVVGTAPVNLAEEVAVNVPKLCKTLEDVKKMIGYSDSCDFEKYTLCQSAYASFKKFKIGPVVFINVLDPAKHKESVAQKEYPVKGKKVVISEFGIVKNTVIIKLTDNSQPLKIGIDYTLDFNKEGYLIVSVTADGAAKTATKLFIAYEKLAPQKVLDNDVIGTKTTTGETGLHLIKRIYPLFNENAGLLLAPGFSKNRAVAIEMESLCENINGCFMTECVIDIDSNTAKNYSKVKGAKEELGIKSSHTIAVWPSYYDGGRVLEMSAIAAAHIIANDYNNGSVPYKSPSNKLIGEGYPCLVDGTKVMLDQEEANGVNAAGVVTALNMSGFRLWGNNTAAFPEKNNAKDRWISIRRFFSWWVNRFIKEYSSKIDENANFRLIEAILDNEKVVCNTFIARGYVSYAEIVFDESGSNISEGKLKFIQKIGGYPPAEFIENVITFDSNTGGEK